MKNECLIYDFETLGESKNCAVVCLAMYKFSEENYIKNPYNFKDVVSDTIMVKFNIEEQVEKYNRVIEKGTLEWWGKLPKDVKKLLNPNYDDISISWLWDIVSNYISDMDIKKVYTRGNAYDPIIMENIFYQTGYGVPYPWWCIRDTRSTLDGLLWNTGIKNTFIVEECKDEFIPHNPKHDIAMDVMRIQKVVQELYGDSYD